MRPPDKRGDPTTRHHPSPVPDASTRADEGAFGLWADLRAWRQRATPDGSRSASQSAPASPRHPGRLADIVGDRTPLRAAAGLCVPGRRRHVIEPYQLPQPEQQAFFAEAMATARAVAELLRPVRVNYELHGNSIPHLHLHLYPRHAGDPFVGGPIDPRQLPVTRDDAQLAALREVIRAACAHG